MFRLRAHRLLCSLTVLGLAGTGCTLEEIDLDDKACPCADGYVCDAASNKCLKSSTATGGASGSGGSSGTTTGGAGGTTTGGAGGTTTGGAGGTTTGGAGGTTTGGAGGTTTGGSGGTGGTTSGGTGGTPTGGSGGTGGVATSGISCGGSTCPTSTEKCCHTAIGTSSAGSCTAATTACGNGFVNMFCDEPGDCPSGSVCCERISAGGGLQNIQCETSAANCVPVGGGASVALLCNPQSPSCPSGLSCMPTPRGYSHCE